jgi:hypothetical protein
MVILYLSGDGPGEQIHWLIQEDIHNYGDLVFPGLLSLGPGS